MFYLFWGSSIFHLFHYFCSFHFHLFPPYWPPLMPQGGMLHYCLIGVGVSCSPLGLWWYNFVRELGCLAAPNVPSTDTTERGVSLSLGSDGSLGSVPGFLWYHFSRKGGRRKTACYSRWEWTSRLPTRHSCWGYAWDCRFFCSVWWSLVVIIWKISVFPGCHLSGHLVRDNKLLSGFSLALLVFLIAASSASILGHKRPKRKPMELSVVLLLGPWCP